MSSSSSSSSSAETASASASASASGLLSQTNELLANLVRLNSNVELFTQVHSLQKKLNALEENYKSLQNNINSSICNAQCEDLNARRDPNSVDDFLLQLLLSKSKSNPPPTVPEDASLLVPAQFVNDERASAPPL
jgi:hypothetical protein